MVKKIVLIAILLLFIVSLARAESNTIGVGLFHGNNIPTSPKYAYDCTIIHPTYGWLLSDTLEVYLEGDIGYYNFEKVDAYSLGISVMIEYILIDPVYIEAGCGVSYWTDTPSRKTIQNDLIGLAKAGIGIKIPFNEGYVGKIGYRFTHSSEVSAKDVGVNAHGIMFSISKSF